MTTTSLNLSFRALLAIHRGKDDQRIPRRTSVLENLAGEFREFQRRCVLTLREPFVRPLSATPVSQFIPEGPHVQVWRKFDDPVLVEAMTADRR